MHYCINVEKAPSKVAKIDAHPERRLGIRMKSGSAMSQLARSLNAELPRLGLATRFRCYAQQNTDLRLAFCVDGDLARCDFAALMEHWERAGRHEGRRTDCQPGRGNK